MFAAGFTKIAEMDEDKKKRLKRGLLVGGATAAALYAGLRRGGKTKLMRTYEGKRPGVIGRAIDRALYGADEIGYTGSHTGGKPTKFKGTVLHTQIGDKEYFKGSKNLGDFTEAQAKRLEDKYREHQLLKSVDKKHPRASILASVAGMDANKLENLYKKIGETGFLIKDRMGFGSGVGGSKFINDGDLVTKYLAGGKIPKARMRELKRARRSPSKYLIQEKMNIKKDPITGASREVRVHAIGDKVIRGAGGPRGSNALDHLYTRQAEDYFQKLLNKMPKSKKPKNMTWAPDIAMTDKGLRVIETNRGAASSGLLDPKYLSKTHGPLAGGAAGLKAMTANNAIYKHITGRHTPLAAAARAGAAGTAVGTAAYKSEAIKNMISKGEPTTPEERQRYLK